MTTVNSVASPKKIITTVRLDPAIKSWAQSFAASRGTDLSTLINLHLFDVRRKEEFLQAPYMSNEQYALYAKLAEDSLKSDAQDFMTLDELRASYNR